MGQFLIKTHICSLTHSPNINPGHNVQNVALQYEGTLAVLSYFVFVVFLA
jgi:hypothetical protein